MNIAFVSSHINKSLQWLWFSRSFRDTGFAGNIVHVIFYDKNTGIPFLAEDLKKENITVYTIETDGALSKISCLIKCVRIFRKHKIDLVHTTLPYGNLYGQLAAFLCGIKKRATTCENASWAHDYKNRKQAFIDNLTFRLAKKIIAVADSAHEYLSTNWNLDPKKLVTIYHGLEEKEYTDVSAERVSKLRKELGIPAEQFVVGMISRLELWKGHEYAIRAMKEIKEKQPSVKLYIFGSEGKDKAYILDLIKSLGLEDTVFYKGFVSDSIALFRLFDIHLHIPVNKYVENCGISIIEGMISGRPQILSLSGYSFQSARHMENAYVVDYCNTEDVTKAILTLYENKDLRDELGKKAKSTAVKEYANTVKVERHIALYKTL
jgi:glycosyltransferase involved in cell wall biosynthesis